MLESHDTSHAHKGHLTQHSQRCNCWKPASTLVVVDLLMCGLRLNMISEGFDHEAPLATPDQATSYRKEMMMGSHAQIPPYRVCCAEHMSLDSNGKWLIGMLKVSISAS